MNSLYNKIEMCFDLFFVTLKIHLKRFKSGLILRGWTVLHRLFRIIQRFVNYVLIIFIDCYLIHENHMFSFQENALITELFEGPS